MIHSIVLNSHTSNWFYRTNRPYFGILRPITWSDRIKDPQDSPLKFNFTAFSDIRFGPRLTEVPHFG